MHFGKAIRAIRMSQEIEQQVLAKRMGISCTYLSQVETNKKKPTIKFVLNACDRLGTSFEELYFKALQKSHIDVTEKDKQNFANSRMFINSLLMYFK